LLNIFKVYLIHLFRSLESERKYDSKEFSKLKNFYKIIVELKIKTEIEKLKAANKIPFLAKL